MKHGIYITSLLLCLLTACTKPVTLVVTNPSLLERKSTLAEISLSELGLDAEQVSHMSLYDDAGNKVDFQLMKYEMDESPSSLLFMVDDIRGGMRREYRLKKQFNSSINDLSTSSPCTAQFVSERKDDFAWENDCAAYRMYGPALAPENPSNGVDLWLKCTDKPIVAKFYDDDLHHGKPYHVNYGEGLDCYKVAHTLGCGGIAPYRDGKLCVGDHFTDYGIISDHGLRVIFYLEYHTHRLVVTCDAGAQMNKAEIWLKDTTIHQMAAGIYLHDRIDNISYSQPGGWAAYAENAVADSGEPQGRNYCAVFMPDAQDIKPEDGHLLVIADVKQSIDNNSPDLTYWFGGGWSQWKYPADTDWFSVTSNTAHNALLPLRVTIR